MRTNPKTPQRAPVHTYEGAPAAHITPEQQLRRSVLSCLLFESEFYEDGIEIAERIANLAMQVNPTVVSRLAVEARSRFNLRHVPLLLCLALVKRQLGTSLASETIAATIQRPDELSEMLSLYWQLHGKKVPLAKQLKLGLAKAFAKFDAYALGRYNTSDGKIKREIKLRDVLFEIHAKPQDLGDESVLVEGLAKPNYKRGVVRRHPDSVFTKLVDRTLVPPVDAWEGALSQATTPEAKRAKWTDLLTRKKLGYMALLRNLRNMEQVGVDPVLVRQAIIARGKGAERVLPFRFITAAKHAPWAEGALDVALQALLTQGQRLPGKTIVVVDVSGSMNSSLSAKSEMTRLHGAAALAAIICGAADDAELWLTAGNDGTRIHKTERVATRAGMALIAQVEKGQETMGGGGIFLTPCLAHIRCRVRGDVDRIIVLTDEQDCAVADKDRPTLADPFGRANFLINVASAKNGVGYGRWVHVDGFSDATLTFIREWEHANV